MGAACKRQGIKSIQFSSVKGRSGRGVAKKPGSVFFHEKLFFLGQKSISLTMKKVRGCGQLFVRWEKTESFPGRFVFP
jgi:hypothetical protein